MPNHSQPLFFDASAEFSVEHGRLPHWEQPGVVVFITFRTWDSIPRDVLESFITDRDNWLRSHGLDPSRPGWDDAITQLAIAKQQEFRRLCATRWEGSLDRCYGSCPLRRPECSRVVADSITHFDGTRYSVFDFVVMPNHVHLLASFPELGSMRKQCASWKHFTATRLNKLLGRAGRFWEEESFDHLVRSGEQFEYLRDYIAANPKVANLGAREFAHYSRAVSQHDDSLPARGASGPQSTDPRSRNLRTTLGENR